MGAYAYGIFIYAIESIQCAHMNVSCAMCEQENIEWTFVVSMELLFFFLSVYQFF